MMRICLCGVLAGQRHTVDCPYPEYQTSDATTDAWVAKQTFILVEPISGFVVNFTADCKIRLVHPKEGALALTRGEAEQLKQSRFAHTCDIVPSSMFEGELR